MIRLGLRLCLVSRPAVNSREAFFYFGVGQLTCPAGAVQNFMKKSIFRWLGLFSIILGIFAWEYLVRLSGLPRFILPSPLDVWTRLLKSLADGSLLYHTGVTLLVIWLGHGIISKVIICALIVFFPVLVNTVVGVRAVPPALYDMMNSLRATRWQVMSKLEVPASLPVLLGGLRIGATLSVIGAIVGELVDAKAGLGFLLKVGDFQYDTSMVFVAVIMLVTLALSLYGFVTLLERKFLKWQT